jgi:three-Cys-motif partner protein
MITANYTGKETEFIKKELLRAYLEPLFTLLGQQEPRISYIDCFSGPLPKGSSSDLSDTSIGISMDIIEKCHNDLQEKFRKNVRFRALFIRSDQKAFDKLEGFLETDAWSGIDAHCLKGNFCDLQDEILSWCGDRDFCFFLIDPASWKDAAIPALQPLLERPSSEFMITFSFDSILRAYAQSGPEEHGEAFLGTARDISRLPQEQKENLLFEQYCQDLKASASTTEGKAPRCAHVRVLYPTKQRTIYDVVYLTWSPVGIVAFMEAFEQFEGEQKKAIAQAGQTKKIKRSRQLEMFSAEKSVADAPRVDPGIIKEYWLSKLSEVPKQFGVEEFADMIEETGWFVDDFQKAFMELEREGRVRNLASTGMRTENAVRYWTNGNRGELLAMI